jgi:cell division protease FtsH
MSEKLGPRVFGSDPHQPFLGRELGAAPSYSEEMAQEIDEEIFRLIDDAHHRAAQVLLEHEPQLHAIAAILIEHETIDKEQFQRLLQGESARDVLTDSQPDTPVAVRPRRVRARRSLEAAPARRGPAAAVVEPPDPAANGAAVDDPYDVPVRLALPPAGPSDG